MTQITILNIRILLQWTNQRKNTSFHGKMIINIIIMIGFVKKVDKESDKAFCMICISKFDIFNDGRSQITKHAETNKHKSAIDASSNSAKIQQFFKNVTIPRMN